jgi:hypothetical protein
VTAAPLTGQCACGAVRFEISEPLGAAGYCHCHRCQRRSGAAASANARVAPGSLAFVAGSEHVREWTPPDGFVKAFCEICGGHLYSRHRTEEIRAVRLGAIDGDPGVRMSYRQRLESACAWEPLPDDGLARYEGPGPGAAAR